MIPLTVPNAAMAAGTVTDIGKKSQTHLILNCPWQVEVDHSTPDEWSRMLDLFEDSTLYQTWSYGAVRWGTKNLSHLVLRRDGEVLAMTQVRVVRPTRFKFGVAYIRWGPLCQRRGTKLDPETVVIMARALEEEYVNKRKLFLRLLPNAFVGSPRAMAIQQAFSKFSPEPLRSDNTYRTFVLDLAPEVEELRAKLDKKWRNQLSRSEKNNLKIVTGIGDDEYRTFSLIYNQMRSRKTFETTVDVEEFGRIQKDLPEAHRMKVLICEDGGTPVAGLVASAIGDSAIYLLGATNDYGLNSKGAYLLQWTLIKWLKENGFKWYDLGGIDPQQNPGVYHFKRGLSGMDVTHMSPLMACTNVVSSAVANAGLAMRNASRGVKEALHHARSLSSQAGGN
jgi:lipid II:glycine glycyltransferase (peptidoglycan interpeptide bridge formation enzyme)